MKQYPLLAPRQLFGDFVEAEQDRNADENESGTHQDWGDSAVKRGNNNRAQGREP